MVVETINGEKFIRSLTASCEHEFSRVNPLGKIFREIFPDFPRFPN